MTSATPETDTWFQVQLSIPWVVPGAPGVQDAINIAVAEVGRRASASKARSSDITVQNVACPGCGHEMEAALCTTRYAMVVLDVLVEIEAESAQQSGRIAKRELGKRMKDIPLTVVDVIALDDDESKPEMEFTAPRQETLERPG